jgi:chromosome segregation ATPase
MAQNEWLGEERRQDRIDMCRHDGTILALQHAIDSLADAIGSGQEELQTCKSKVDFDISNLHTDMTELRSDVSTIRADMHALTASVGEMKTSLATIADSIKAIADFPDTWVKIKGFWSVMRFLRDNWILLAIMGAVAAYVTGITVRDITG